MDMRTENIKSILTRGAALFIALLTAAAVFPAPAHAKTPGIVDGKKYTYKTNLSNDALLFNVGSGDDKYKGTCCRMGLTPKDEGTATAHSVENSGKLAKIAYQYGEKKGWYDSTGDANDTLGSFGLPKGQIRKGQTLMMMLQAVNMGYSNWKSVCVSEGYASEAIANIIIDYLKNGIDYDKIDVPDNFDIHKLDCGNENQPGVVWRFSEEGYLALTKTGASPGGLYVVKTAAWPLRNPDSAKTLAGAVYHVYTDASCTVRAKAAPSGSLSLAGAKYNVYTDSACSARAKDLSGNSFQLVTDANGRSNTAVMAIGTYWVKEVTASPGYALDPAVHKIKVAGTSDEDDPAMVSSTEPLQEGTEDVVLTTGADGVSNAASLKPGTYYVKEVTPSPGYDLDPDVKVMTVPDTGGDTPVSSTEKPSTGYVCLTKSSGNTDITG